MEVKVYSTPACPYCKMVKEYLTSKGVVFEAVDVSANPAAGKDLVNISGQMGVPVVVAGGEVIVGFDKEAINKALNL